MTVSSTTRNLSMARRSLFMNSRSALLSIIDCSGAGRSLPLGAGLFSVAGDLEDVDHTQIPLVTRVLDQLALGWPHRQQHRPRLLPGRRIADGEPELDPVLSN